MNGRPLTDAQISRALRAHLPDRAEAGLRERVLVATQTTGQQRVLPSFFGALSDADPVTRRRSLLIAAALLVALALASAAVVGGLRLLQREPVQDLSLETPAEVQAFVFSSYDRLPHLAPVAITTLESDGSKDRIYVDRSGAVRLERYASADATEPATSMLLGGSRFGRTLTVGPNKVWVEQDEAIGEDPRLYLLALSGLHFSGGSGCEMRPSELGDSTTAPAWRYVGADSVAGRPARHFACGGGDLWLDDETRLILRVRQQDTDDAGNTIPGAFRRFEVTKVEFGDQLATLFAFAPPDGVAAMSLETYDALCRPGQDTVAFLDYPPCSGTPRPAVVPPTPEPEPSPTPVVHPDTSDCAIPSPDPSEPTGPLAWTQASLKHDWPAPVRAEAVGGATVLPMPPTYIDPSGDTGSEVLPCVDIRDLTVDTYDVSVHLVANRAPDVDPSEAWIAYGVVVDEDRDGVPDWRYGIDNSPRPAEDHQGHHRAWRTDLHTGRTESAAGSEEFGKVGETFFSTGYPTRAVGADARFSFGDRFDVAGQGIVTKGIKLDMPLYAWASVIVDGRVVATDYAPDAGWLLPSPGSKPGGTYVVHPDDRFPLRLSMSVPKGWTAYGPNLYDGAPENGIGLEFMIVDQPAEWGCDASGDAIQAQIGKKVDDLVAFLAGQQMIRISENIDVTLDGYRGKYLEYTTTVTNDNCHGPDWPLITTIDNQQHNQVWILDVDGVRLVINGFAPKASETVKAEVRWIVESIDIGP